MSVAADDTRRVVNPSRTGCRCVNHMRTPKQQHTSKDAAITAILDRVLERTGTATPYECPTAPGIWHVGTTKRPK